MSPHQRAMLDAVERERDARGFTCICGDCDRELTFKRDPALEVTCPTCGAEGRCRRPSGHRSMYGYVHPARDVVALMQGKYGDHRAEGGCRVSQADAIERALKRITSIDRRNIARLVRT